MSSHMRINCKILQIVEIEDRDIRNDGWYVYICIYINGES